ncbi:hypothetical protein DV711_09415 [Motiliproteus coralliicola]|uniref:Uncharacterized protein n=1 Tax=Motiliproteus coralliicola TaxID=2283196 RepID=A0A369WM41_9GAMM|nr:hypothetical protein [Motiliproteus coralliicola]RDE22782.1 hypothetical protein DV711_09415 [Motiliproteus coralliicola]
MSQQSDLLQHDAELILSLYGNSRAQKQRLLRIESELKAEGVNIERLHQQIDSLASKPDPELYRCCYHVYE